LHRYLLIADACANFSPHATSQENFRRPFLDRNARGCPRPSTGRGVVRQQDQENLRADADPRAAQASQEFDRAEEKRGGRKISDAKAICHSAKISVALFFEEEKIFREPHSRGEYGAGCIRLTEEKEKVFSHARPGFLTEAIPEEKKEIFSVSGAGFFAERFSKEETQAFPVADSNTRGITGAFFEPDRVPGSRRNS
jgi:hypothetical protein